VRRPCAIAVLAAALLAAGGSPAAAQVAVPRDAPVVAGPTPSGATLVAFERRGELCIAVRDRNARDDEPTCGRVPRRASDTLTVTGFTRDQALHGGATSGDVATAQLHFARRGRPLPVVDAPTEAGARFGGPGAGRLRFFLAQGPATTPWLARYLAADGRTLAATGSRFDSPSSRPAVTLATGSAGRRLRVTSRQALAATPLDRGRLVEEHCLELQGSGGRGPCATVDEPLVGDLDLDADRPCGRTSLTVATSARVTRVDAVLGDGRRAAVPLSALPAGLPLGTRGGALIVDGPTAIRRLEGFDAAGGRVATEVLALPPAQPCGLGLSGRFDVFGFPFDTAQRGPLALQVRDDGARLCLSLGTPDPRGADCAVPPVDTFGTSFRVRRAGGRALVATVLPEEVAAVDLEVDGRVRRIATTPDVPGYGGQYSGAVRFFVAEFPARTALGSARLLDAEGGCWGAAASSTSRSAASGRSSSARRDRAARHRTRGRLRARPLEPLRRCAARLAGWLHVRRRADHRGRGDVLAGADRPLRRPAVPRRLGRPAHLPRCAAAAHHPARRAADVPRRRTPRRRAAGRRGPCAQAPQRADRPAARRTAVRLRRPGVPRVMATWDDVDRIALALPETAERPAWGSRMWRVRDKGFVWERPLRKSDLAALGDAAPDGPILGAKVEHLVAKEALLQDGSGVFFTTPHFDGYPAVLVLLDRIDAGTLEEVITEAWINAAPKRLAKAYLEERG
jgi:hypothetical protein